MRTGHRWCRVALVPALLALAPVQTAAQQPHQSMAFVTVALDPETRQADTVLERYLKDKTGLGFDTSQMEYEEAIHRLASWPEGRQSYLARMTPYAYVAAEMLGARFEILATYNSKATTQTTYHSYFVVNRKRFGRPDPGLGDLLEYLKQGQARFVYHDRFSTSSYFLPSLYFRRQRIFMTDEAPDAGDGLIRIQVNKVDGSSSGLVEQVARGTADLAAVWDGTKQKFAGTPVGAQVHFIQLPDALPNDLLVVSRWAPAADVGRLRQAVREMSRSDAGEIHTGDYRWWVDFRDADSARLALANLRRLAEERPAPVTVAIQAGAGLSPDAQASLEEPVEAARQAVRLSASELVLHDEMAFDHKDVVWTLMPIHDGAVNLETDIVGSELPPQEFQISFTNLPDLTKRIGTLIHSRMHRIRYVWPYEDTSPTIIRDVDFDLPVGTVLKARRITWLNPERNRFREGAQFDAGVAATDFYKFLLDGARFPKSGSQGGWAYEPMSNVAYRVVLIRPTEEPFLFQALTVTFVALLAGAAGACCVDLRRKDTRSVR